MNGYVLRYEDEKDGQVRSTVATYDDRRAAIYAAIMLGRPADARTTTRRMTLADPDGKVMMQYELAKGCPYEVSYTPRSTEVSICEAYGTFKQALARREELFYEGVALPGEVYIGYTRKADMGVQ